MIYASLKPIRQWRTGWTPAAYLLLGHWSGALIAVALAIGYGGEPVSWAWLAAGLGVAALVVKLGYWRHGAADRGGKSALTLEQAIGVPQGVRPPGVSVAQARLFDAGHTQRTFLTDEFVFRIARQHAQAAARRRVGARLRHPADLARHGAAPLGRGGLGRRAGDRRTSRRALALFRRCAPHRAPLPWRCENLSCSRSTSGAAAATAAGDSRLTRCRARRRRRSSTSSPGSSASSTRRSPTDSPAASACAARAR